MSSIADIAKKMYEHKANIEELNAQVKSEKEKYSILEDELIEELGHIGINRFDLQGVGSFHIHTRKFYKMSDRDSFKEFLHDQGDEDILTVPHQTLNAYIKEKILQAEERGEEDFTIPGTEFTTKSQIRLRKL